MDELKIVLDYVVIPLFIWVWKTDRDLVKLKAEQIKKEDLEKIYNLIRELSNNNDKKYVAVNSCNSRHNLDKC